MLAPAVGSGAPVRNGNSEMSSPSLQAAHSARGTFYENAQINMGLFCFNVVFVNCVDLNKYERSNTNFMFTKSQLYSLLKSMNTILGRKA